MLNVLKFILESPQLQSFLTNQNYNFKAVEVVSVCIQYIYRTCQEIHKNREKLTLDLSYLSTH